MTQQFNQSIVPGKANAVKVVGGNLHGAIRLWKRNLKISNILNELHERREYTKPSTKRKERLQAAKYKAGLK